MRKFGDFAASLLEEDLGRMDVTTVALGIGRRTGVIACSPKERCVLAGVEEAESLFALSGCDGEVLRSSGTTVKPGGDMLEDPRDGGIPSWSL